MNIDSHKIKWEDQKHCNGSLTNYLGFQFVAAPKPDHKGVFQIESFYQDDLFYHLLKEVKTAGLECAKKQAEPLIVEFMAKQLRMINDCNR